MKTFIYSLILLTLSFSAYPDTDDFQFSDETLSQTIQLPDWFKLSFLDLKDDIIDAESARKKGLILYFGRKDCPYCKALIENNWSRDDIVFYTNKHFDVVAIDTKGIKSVTDFDGLVYDEKQYSIKMQTNFTPSLLFYNLKEELVLKLSGYQQPYRFMAALEYVADEHYKQQSFSVYMSLANEALDENGKENLNNQPYFELPPYNLSRKHFKAERPLAVFFEKKHCHACDVLHSNPLENPLIRQQLENLDVIQLELNSSQLIVTPEGEKTTVNAWGKKLALHYSPTIIFFDETGQEIIRIDSVVWVNRLGRVLDFINSKGYQSHSSFQDWRISNGKTDH
ncbi:MAG: thioredoxin fold domain-containing protein [Gammaproteobacteria bacterium]|nr:thioredoxin fold domain-containing protein [Gammaproteobacteria bacterium]